MHLQRKAWRHFVLAAALVTFALPLAGPLTASPANAQVGSAQPFSIGKAFPTACTPSTAVSASGAAGTTSTDCYVEVVEPGANYVSNSIASFNMIGSEHTFTFICDALVSTLTGTPNLPPDGAGCYNVSFSVQDITTGSQSPVVQATCGNVAAPVSGDCSGASSPICPVGTGPAPQQGTTTPCNTINNTFPGVAGYTAFNTATVTINPGANHEYRATFTGYIPSFPTPPGAQPSCPNGTTPAPGIVLSTSTGTGSAPGSFSTTPGGACRFSVSADKKYIEVTTVTLTDTCAGGSLFFAEGLKAFFGPSCATDAIVTGTIVVKTNVNCTNGTEPATGADATNYPSQPEGASDTSNPLEAQYSCVGDTLSVVNAFLPSVKLDFSASGPASFNILNTLGTSCAGVAGSTTLTALSEEGTDTATETDATLCPTGPGAGSVKACLSQPLPNNQPLVCSNSVTFSFTQNARRVVPQVRWAGEKIALTKCFGPALADNTVEFVLKGNAGGLNATLLPVDLGSTIQLTGNFPTQNTIWTVTDQNGCATVIGFADGEGQMLVDAAIYADNGAGFAVGSPLINEHVFEVFYLKFDHLDLENINPATTYSTVSALAPYTSWIAGTADVLGATTFPTSFTLPSAPGANNQVAGPTGFAVPLCQTQFIRAMVHGYFEIAGDPSGRPATSVAIPGSPLTNGGTASAGSYVLPAGRWVLPEDWPVLATFAGFGLPGQPGDFSPASVLAWDLNSGWVFNPSGENPVFCPPGLGVFAAPVLEAGSIPVATSSAGGDVNVGPCSSKDGNGTVYESAPDPLCNANASTGLTVGFSGFDPNQACTNPFPLTYTPSGATLIGGIVGGFSCAPGVVGPCLIPNGPNSTYLPNATLNQWDAPMPEGQISFGITSGPGFLQQVNKTGLYSISFDLGAANSSDACSATGYAENDSTETCQLVIEPDPFYAAAIPSSPLIPPITNNGGYLFNSWNFASGSVTTTTGPGFVPGQSTSVGSSDGGSNVTACTSSAASGDSVVVADGTGFLPGMSVEVYRDSDGVTVAGRDATTPFTASTITITNVLPASVAGFPNAKVLVFAFLDLSGVCNAGTTPDTFVFIAEQFGLPVPSAAAFSVGSSLSLGSFAGTSIGFAPIVAIDSAANIVYIENTDAVADVFGGAACDSTGFGSNISRPIDTTTCEPDVLVPAGTLVESGPVAAGGLGSTQVGPPPNLYPFWQWVSTPQASGSTSNTAATVYSDNHGEAVVALGTGIATQINPVAATTGGALSCPSPYLPLFVNSVIITCQLPLQLLGPAGFSNVTAALSAFSAAKPGCIQTFPTGTFAAVPTPANGQVIGATGPTAGQICINNLGGIEFGASATLGSTTVQAQADYPYFRGEHAPIGSAPLTKVFTSAFAKTLTVSAGTPGPAGTTSYVVTITARDVCGNPLFGEPVQVYALGNAGAAVLAPVSGGTVISANTTSAVLTVDPNTGQAVLSLEILNTAIGTQGLVVKAVFPFERIERFVTVIPGTTPGQVQNVPYAPGWNQVGGPAGSNFSVAEALFSYDAVAGAYINAAASAGALSSAAPACTGYWAYFAAPMVVAISVTSHSGDTAACALKAGWNLVGNPFGTAASIPSGLTAYHWNGTSYDVVGQIPVGGSVWIFNDGTHNAVTLTAT